MSAVLTAYQADPEFPRPNLSVCQAHPATMAIGREMYRLGMLVRPVIVEWHERPYGAPRCCSGHFSVRPDYAHRDFLRYTFGPNTPQPKR